MTIIRLPVLFFQMGVNDVLGATAGRDGGGATRQCIITLMNRHNRIRTGIILGV